MKAEEALESAYKIIRDNQSDKHEDVDPPLINAIKEYARIQIENHIESIRENPIYTDGSIDLESTLNNTPINLD